MFSHRSSLKQSNKPFKSKHATKGSIKRDSKGRVSKSSSHGVSNALSKSDRKNANRIEIRKKRVEALQSSKLFQGLNSCPKIVAVVPLCPDVDAFHAIECLSDSIGQSDQLRRNEAMGSLLLPLDRFRQTIQFIPTKRHLLDILDAAKVADIVVFLLSATEEVDAFGELVLTTIKSQGVPSIVNVVQHLESHSAKKQADIRKSLISYMQHHFPDEQKLFSIGTEAECVASLRHLSLQRIKSISWRDRHSYLVADSLDFLPNDPFSPSHDSQTGTLCVTGYIRGNLLSANRLVHIPSYGDFQVSQIVASTKRQSANAMDQDQQQLETVVLHQADPALQDSLVSENIPDPMEGEQTWPTDEEIKAGEANMEKMMLESNPLFSSNGRQMQKRLVPKGTSSYQAAWMIEEEEVEDSQIQESMAEMEQDVEMPMFQDENEPEDGQDVAEQFEYIDMEDREMTFDVLDEDEEQQQLQEFLQKQRESREDLQFPDEVDTPQDIPARERFQRYRGMKSFRTSPWDPYENLPVDYSRTFQFQNFKRSKKRVLDSVGQEGVAPGTYVSIHIKNVPKDILERREKKPFAIFSLLPYENKMSLMNVVVRRHGDYTEPIKSKDSMLIMIGFRAYIVNPIYSTYTRGGTNNVHKFERFLQMGRESVATFYAPIQFGPAPVLMFKYPSVSPSTTMGVSESQLAADVSWTSDKHVPLVGLGSLMDVDPLRVIAKRIILTGHPYKVHKRGAVVRYMFFTPEDIRYFKPVQLTTKHGRVGHIKESLGTHGYMKCIFDTGIKQHDTVCMYLYKRVFPKWSTVLFKASNGDWKAMEE